MDEIVWEPKNPEISKMWEFMNFAAKRLGQAFPDYQSLYDWSINKPKEFWPYLGDFLGLNFDKPADEILNDYQEMIDAKWFSGAYFNFAQKLLSRQDDNLAIVSLNEANKRETLSFKELYQEVAKCRAGLDFIGIKSGARIAAVMPNTAHTIVAMLATTSMGAIWSSCSPDFGADAILDRLSQIEPEVLFITDGHQYQGKQYSTEDKIKNIIKAIASLKQVVIIPNINVEIDLPDLIYWDDFIKPASNIDFISLPFNHPLYILFSSGTTGKPKCIMHGAGGTLLQHLKELALHSNINKQSNLCFYTTCGWMMWNWMVSSLALGARLTLYEGAPTFPLNNSLFKLLADESVTTFGTSAKFLSAIEKAGVQPKNDFNFKNLECILTTGSPLLPTNYDFVYKNIKKAVQLSSISGGTDIISCFALGNPLLPVYRGEIQCLGLGMAAAVFDEHGKPTFESRGELVCTKPFPSMPLGFWKDPELKAYKAAYFEHFPGVWTHGDFAALTRHGGLIIYGRSDSVLNPGGVRIGTAEIYRQVEKIEEVIDCIVIGQPWQDDERIILFVVLRENLRLNAELCNRIREIIRQQASPRHVPAKIIQVPEVPRTINGKLVEIAVRQVVQGEPVQNLQALANPHCLDYFKNRAELND